MSRHNRKPEGPSLEALAGFVSGLVVVYLVIEGMMPGNKHPIHWLVTLLGGVAGYGIGAFVFRLKERRDLYGSVFGKENLSRKSVDASGHRRNRR